MAYVLRIFPFSETFHSQHFTVTTILGVRWPRALSLFYGRRKATQGSKVIFFPKATQLSSGQSFPPQGETKFETVLRDHV